MAKNAVRRIRIALPMLGLASLLLVVSWRLGHGRVERVRTIPAELGSGLNRARIAVPRNDTELNAFMFIPTGDKVKEHIRSVIASEGTASLLSIGNSTLYYLRITEPPPKGIVLMAKAGPPTPYMWLPQTRAAVRAISLKGGAPYTIRAGLNSSAAAVSGGWLYWIKANPYAIDPKNYNPNTGRVHELYRAPLTGGPPRKLVSGMGYTDLNAVGSGISWTNSSSRMVAKAYVRDELTYFLGAGETVPWLVRTASLSVMDRLSDIVEYKNRLYWVENRQHLSNAARSGIGPITNKTATGPGYWDANLGLSGSPGASGPQVFQLRQEIVSVLLDGTGRKVEMTFDQASSGKSVREINIHRGKMYTVLTEPPKEGSGYNHRDSLCEIQPGRPDPIRPVFTIPSDAVGIGVFDGNYYYFTANEEHENWFDWSPNGLRNRVEQVLFRIRLPD